MENFKAWYKESLLHDSIITKIKVNNDIIKLEIDSSCGYYVKNVKYLEFYNAKIVKKDNFKGDLVWCKDNIDIRDNYNTLSIYVQDLGNGFDGGEIIIQFLEGKVEFI